MRFAFVFALLPLMFAAASAAETPGAKAALAVTDGFVVPHYRALAEAADAQVRAWDVFCNGRARGQEETLRAAYNTLADRWAEIEFIKGGPLSLFLRSERFYYWPELRNATTTGLTALLASDDAHVFDPARLVYDNIPAQGLPAIERLLYEPEFAQNPNRCRVGQAIARNLAAIAHDVLNEWTVLPSNTGNGGVRAAIAANKGWNNNLFANADEAGGMLFTDMIGAITAINDRKLSAQMNAADKRTLDGAFDAAVVAVKALPTDIPAGVADTAARPKFLAARAALKAAQVALAATVPHALNLSLGFNSLDGD